MVSSRQTKTTAGGKQRREPLIAFFVKSKYSPVYDCLMTSSGGSSGCNLFRAGLPVSSRQFVVNWMRLCFLESVVDYLALVHLHSNHDNTATGLGI